MDKHSKPSEPNLFILFSICGILLIVFLGWLFHYQYTISTSRTLKQTFFYVPERIMMESFEMAIPYLGILTHESEDPPKPISLYLFETLTNLEPSDLASVVSRELPGLRAFNEKTAVDQPNQPNQHAVSIESPAPSMVENSPETPTEKNSKIEEQHEQVVLIYNTHNTESWTHVSDNPDVTDDKKNISLVSKKLSEELQKRGIKAKFDPTDHQKLLKENGLPYAFSYAQSLKMLKEATKEQNIHYFLDIHRDSFPKEMTTTNIDGKSYARISFVVGKGHQNWEKNDEFAQKIHSHLEQEFPDLSRGIDYKGTAEGNGEYNQSLSPNSVLVEIGGIDNTLEECYNTAAALADVLADTYFQQDKKADSSPTG
ncbi:stage II sporulation protein P [Ammoniphilus sp. 3BR4]